MAFPLNFGSVRPLVSDVLWPLAARLRPTADAVLVGSEVRLLLGDKTFSAPLPAGDASPQAAEQAVASLLALLEKSALIIGGLRLVASDRWLRPLVFPLGDEAMSDEELESVLAHQYRQVFGKLMTGWSWSWDRQPNGLVLAMAWPDALLALRPLLAERGVRLVSAQPYSISAMRGLAVPPGPAWCVFVEAGCVSFVRLAQDGWRHWRVIAATGATAEFVSSQLLRLVAQVDDECRCVWLLAPGVAAEWSATVRRLLADAGWLVNLSGKEK